MRVINNTSFPIIAHGVWLNKGYGPDVLIQPGESKKVPGLYVGVMGNGECFVQLNSPDITCHEGEYTDDAFHVSKGKRLCLQGGGEGITIRHHEDDVESQVVVWREANEDIPEESST